MIHLQKERRQYANSGAAFPHYQRAAHVHVCALPPVPVDVDISGLADSVAAVLRLGVHSGVPVTVVEHHCVSPSQVHPDTSAASG